MTEKQLMQNAIALLRRHGYLVFHPFDSRRSEPGWPDLFAVHPDNGKVFAIECKSEKGRTTRAQRAWLKALLGVKVVDAFVLRPGPDLEQLEALL